jgi:aromatic-L-amino-acid decarboxylase
VDATRAGTTLDRSTALDTAQREAAGDMPEADLRAALHATADLVADYLARVESYAVLPPIAPGELTERLAGPPPEDPEPLQDILRDVRDEVIPNVTHWQHPAYFAYFPASASGIGLLGEMITSGLNANAFLWRTSPAGAELEAIAVDWLREGLGLPPDFDGILNDTASTSSLAALAAARQGATGDAADSGLGGRPALRVYASEEAHSSITKAAMILGIGRDGVHSVAVDGVGAMDPGALQRAIAADRAEGRLPAAVVATIGTTSTTAVDPLAAIADICQAEGLWLHVDAAYAGATALIPALRDHFVGWERADSIVVNPHKWLFTPLDCSLLLTRRPDLLRAALSLVPEYMRATDGRVDGRDYSEYTPQLGRRARGIKMWMLLRYFGLAGLRARVQAHLDLAAELAGWIDADPDFERLAPVPFGLVCFRWRPTRYQGRDDAGGAAAELDTLNARLLDALNATGRVFLSHTRIGGRFALRIALGNVRTERRHVEDAWALVRTTAAGIGVETS